MMATSSRILDAATTQLAATINGVECAGIPCHLENGAIVIDGDGEIPDAVREWIAAGNTPETYALPPVDLAAYAAQKRYDVEVGGFIDGDGRNIATDRDSQGKLLAEKVAISDGLRSDPSGWKLKGNSFVMLANAEMLAVITAARAHIANAFAVEASVLAAIEAGTITTTAQIDSAPWPSNGP